MGNSTPSEVLAAYGCSLDGIKNVSADDDSMLIVHSDATGRDFGIIIEFDAVGVTEMASYLSAHGIAVDRNVVIEQFGK